MRRITQQSKSPRHPTGQFLHVQQLPDLDRGGLDFLDQSEYSRIKIPEDLEKLRQVALFRPFYTMSVRSITLCGGFQRGETRTYHRSEWRGTQYPDGYRRNLATHCHCMDT